MTTLDTNTKPFYFTFFTLFLFGISVSAVDIYEDMDKH